jgi:hypothetical protein
MVIKHHSQMGIKEIDEAKECSPFQRYPIQDLKQRDCTSSGMKEA